MQLTTLSSSGLAMADNDCFLVLLINSLEPASSIRPVPEYLATTFDSLCGSMTPRGLRTSVCNSLHANHSNSLAFTMYIYSGKRASPNLKQHVFSKCFEMERLLNSCDQLLGVMFGGGVVRNKKLQKGSLVNISREEDGLASLASFVGEIDLVNVICSKPQPSIRNLLGLPARPLKRITNERLTTVTNPTKKAVPTLNYCPPPSNPTPIPPAPAPSNKIKTPILNLAIKPF